MQAHFRIHVCLNTQIAGCPPNPGLISAALHTHTHTCARVREHTHLHTQQGLSDPPCLYFLSLETATLFEIPFCLLIQSPPGWCTLKESKRPLHPCLMTRPRHSPPGSEPAASVLSWCCPPVALGPPRLLLLVSKCNISIFL